MPHYPLTVNLTQADFTTADLPVPAGADRATVDVEVDSTLGWQTAKVDLQWRIDKGTIKDKVFRAFNPVVQLDSTTTAIIGVSIAGVTHVNLKVTTADGDADPAAEYVIRLT